MALIKCPSCGNPVSDRAKQCPSCGKDIGNMYCQYCGNMIFKDSVICPKCGRQLKELKAEQTYQTPMPTIVQIAPQTVPVTQKKKRLPWPLRTSGILLIGFFTGGIWWILGPIIRIGRK